jgi:HEPN domain-containing protein
LLPITREWVDKAEGDFSTMQRELRARKSPNYDAASFHAQQCAEKYLKARLQEEGLAFTKTHNLVALLDLLLPVEAMWDAMRADLAWLTTSAVEVRYPGETADRDDAKEAARVCKEVRTRVRERLGLI